MQCIYLKVNEDQQTQLSPRPQYVKYKAKNME